MDVLLYVRVETRDERAEYDPEEESDTSVAVVVVAVTVVEPVRILRDDEGMWNAGKKTVDVGCDEGRCNMVPAITPGTRAAWSRHHRHGRLPTSWGGSSDEDDVGMFSHTFGHRRGQLIPAP